MESRSNEMREELSSQVGDTTESTKARAQEFASATAARARDMTSRLGHKVRDFAGRVREVSPHEKVRSTTNQFADTLDNAGTYLEEKNLQGMIDDVAAVIRKYPMQSLLFGIGIGFLLSRKKSERNPKARQY